MKRSRMTYPINKGYGDAGASWQKKATKGFRAMSGSPKEDIDANNAALRQRARMLYMAAPIATSAIKTNRTNVIGVGLKLQSRIDRTGMMVLRKMELEEQIEERLAEEREERAALEAMIRQVENPDERAVLRLRYFDRADWDGICAVLFSDRQDYLERIDSYQNRTYKAHGRALLRMAEILKETEAPAVKGSKRQ